MSGKYVYSLDGIRKHKSWIEVTFMDHSNNRIISRKGRVNEDDNYHIWVQIEGTQLLVPDEYALRFMVDPNADTGRVFT